MNFETNYGTQEFLALVEGKTLIIPKNSGLVAFQKEITTLPNTKVFVRGEDVPLFVDALTKQGTACVGLTGQDLLKEYKLKNPLSMVQEVQNLGWKDKDSLFGKPTLCLLGPEGKQPLSKSIVSLEKKPTIAINAKYRALAEQYLGKLSQKGVVFEKLFLFGATEAAAQVGIANFVIDIVCSGASAREAGLSVYERIFESDVVLVGVRE